VLPLSYYIEVGYGAGKLYLNQSTLTFPAGKYLGTLQIGQFQAPMGLENISSSRDITFMEPAAPVQAIAPGIEAGAQVGKPVFGERATWALGLFTPGAGARDYGDAS
jgi:phosphate-selective porin